MQRALEELLERDGRLREASVARFMAVASGVGTLAALALGPKIGWAHASVLAGGLVVLAFYFFVQDRALRRGWYSPALRWVNVAIEVSVPSLFFLADFSLNGVEYALTAPVPMVWPTLVALSGFRGSRALSLAAGSLAAIECFALYAFFGWPNLPSESLVTLSRELYLVRVPLLFASGVVTALFVGHLNRRAAEALVSVRMRDVMGKYLLHDRIGIGGMAEVFRATYSPEGGFEKTVALKRILPEIAANEQMLRLFRLEAELCSRLNHPNVVQVLDFGRFGESFFLAMEYVEGVSLRKLLDVYQQGLPLSAVVHIAVELCQALDYVHRRVGRDGEPLNLVHRDLNPPNVLLSTLGEVKVADFGIARVSRGVDQTQMGIVKGKPGYLAPEQLAGEAIDARADLFALGTTLHECLTGRRLFVPSADQASLSLLFVQPIPKPSQLVREIPPELDAVVMGLLERALPARLQSAQEALSVLVKVAQVVGPGQEVLAKCVRRAESERAGPTKEPVDSVMAENATIIERNPQGASSELRNR